MVGSLAAALAQAFVSWQWATPLWFIAIGCMYLFRDPERVIPPLPLAVVSPIDGKVVNRRSIRDPYLDREAVVLKIRLRPTGVYSIRSPIEGKIMKMWSGLPPGSGVGDVRGVESFAIWVQTDELDDVVLAVEIWSRLFRPRCFLEIGERVGQGQRCGMLRFGAKVSVYMPGDTRVAAEVGTRLLSGSDVIGTLVHQEQRSTDA